ncbi:hypothetical protein [Romboutsia lituseburensis]|uniref:hypothetical protein n=1 Tax=Romboutsia lituseburensis TaxID=1537 RepID=UPI0022EB815C|nr:hypothetical protein [Romboutsia lituseburensis]
MNILDINQEGNIDVINLDSTNIKPDLNIDFNNISFEHLMIYDFNGTYKLVIDSFNDKMELIEKEVLDKLINNPEKLHIKQLEYYANKFINPKSDPGRDRLIDKYNNSISKNKPKVYSFIICPTYSCNMSCIYCYQQGNEDLNKKVISEENLEKIFDYIVHGGHRDT